MDNIYENEVGKVFRVDTGIDLTGYTFVKLLVLTPVGEKEWTDVVVTEGQPEYSETKGLTVIQYTTKEGDLVPHGDWMIMAYVEWGDTRHYGEPAKFVVYRKWEPEI